MGTSCPSLLKQCVGSLMSHIEVINMEGILRQGLWFIVLVRED